MKTQVAWNFRLSRTELQVSLQRGESLDMAGVAWLEREQSELLLPLDYEPDKVRSKKLLLRYDITGNVALKRRLPKVWSEEGHYNVLEGIERVCAECASGKRLIERILFDVEHVYLTEEGEPRFAYVPLDGVAYDATQNSPLLVLAALSSRRLRFDSAAGLTHAAHLRQFVLAREVFSPNDFRSFLDEEYPELRQDSRGGASSGDQRGEASDAQRAARLDALFAGFSSSSDEGDDWSPDGTSSHEVG